MKKICSLFLVVACLITITGCGSNSKNEITCTQKDEEAKVTATVKTDKNDKITNVKMTVEMAASSKEELDSTYEFMKTSAEEMNKNEGVKYNVSKKDLNLIVETDVDLNKISDDVKESLNMEEFETTGTEFRKSAEKEGATCK